VSHKQGFMNLVKINVFGALQQSLDYLELLAWPPALFVPFKNPVRATECLSVKTSGDYRRPPVLLIMIDAGKILYVDHQSQRGRLRDFQIVGRCP